jgi:5-methylcytosine-specific restriction endonuclease McrA
MTLERCTRDGYALVQGQCPMCDGRSPGNRDNAPFLPDKFRAIPVTRQQFITVQHYQAWLSGRPLRRHLEHRKKFSREEQDIIYRHLGRRCVECGRTDYLTLDHIVPQILGGSSLHCNLRVLCQTHNREAFAEYRPVLKESDRLAQGAA